MIQSVRRGQSIASDQGGKEVHADDVAKAVQILLSADGVAGQAYNCYDMYISQQRVAEIAKRITGSSSEITPLEKKPKNQIDVSKLKALGMVFGGEKLLEQTIRDMLDVTT